MNPLSQVAFGLVVLIFVNQVVMRFTNLWRRSWLFWTLQAINAAVGVSIMVFGLPLIQERTATLVVGGLFMLRIVFNISQWVNLWTEEREKAREEEYQRLQAEIEAMRKEDEKTEAE
jgi:hypothetical protein